MLSNKENLLVNCKSMKSKTVVVFLHLQAICGNDYPIIWTVRTIDTTEKSRRSTTPRKFFLKMLTNIENWLVNCKSMKSKTVAVSFASEGYLRQRSSYNLDSVYSQQSTPPRNVQSTTPRYFFVNIIKRKLVLTVMAK